jgi:Fe-S-cluster-containing dehydrogenase component
MKYGMLIDYGLCSGCKSCEIACRKEKGLPLEEWGITVEQIGPKKLGGEWEWDNVPVPSRLCDLCAERRAEGKKASCELHCLAQVIEVLPLEEIPQRMMDLGHGKVSCFVPR